MRAKDRLPAETIDLAIENYDISVSLAYGADTGILREIVFVKKPGKQGSELAEMFHDLGIQLSRVIQHRDPKTGDEWPL